MGSWDYAASIPASTFRGAMSVPRVHHLVRLDGRIRLVQQPVPALARLRGASYEAHGLTLDAGTSDLPPHVRGDRLEIRAVLRPGTATRLGLHVRVGAEERTVVGYDADRGSLFVDRRESGQVDFHPSFAAVHHAPLASRDGAVTFTVLVDTTSVEVFGGVGECVITDQFFPDPGSRGLALFAEGGTGTVDHLSITALDQPRDARAEVIRSGCRGDQHV
jgi:sucrose-6-phosphate hydrolase SacC (GH32 family)